MAAIDLSKYGITDVQEIIYNPSYEQLFQDEMDPSLTGYDKGVNTELDAVNVMTGIYTGRSPKDKFIVMDEKSKDTVWWTTPEYPNDNHPATQEAWDACKKLAAKYKVPYIDVNGIMVNHYNSVGYNKAVSYHMAGAVQGSTDMTHFNEGGAKVIAGLIANAVKSQGISGLSGYVK